jgi:cathepsin L
MRTFAAAAIAAVASSKMINSQEFEFVQYMAEYGKSYADVEEYNLRFALWQKWDAEIKELNANQTTSVHSHNHISDWTAVERTGLTGMKNVRKNAEYDAEMPRLTAAANQALPSSVNWVTVTPAKVNPVQDQGQCGSCWAFSATASQESSLAISSGTLYKFSEQNYVSCSFLQGNLGCNGGMYGRAWNYAKTHPVMYETAYPYTSGTTMKSGSCTYDATQGHGGVSSFFSVGTDNTSIMTAIVQMPVSIAIEADTVYFQSYTSGVLTDAAACGTTLDHAVVAVGYGTDPTYGPYYLVRNSWSASWGDQGYVKLAQLPAPGMCGMNQDVMGVYATFQ